MRILLTGANGQLGRELWPRLSARGEVLATSRSLDVRDEPSSRGFPFRQLDLTDSAATERLIRDFQPQLIVHSAAYTHVDQAEEETALAMRINSDATATLARAAAACDAAIVYFSTDYVFAGSGNRAWQELDQPAPCNAYGRSKFAGEEAVRRATAKHLIVRISWLYGPHGRNFAKTLLRLARQGRPLRVVNDQVGAPSPAWFVADETCELLDHLQQIAWSPVSCGTYHLATSGATTWFDFAASLVHRAVLLGVDCSAARVIPITTTEFAARAVRPKNSQLDCDKLATMLGRQALRWEEAMDRTLPQIIQSLGSERILGDG